LHSHSPLLSPPSTPHICTDSIAAFSRWLGVLPIGGLKQKVLAAHAAGLTEVIVPERNQPDLDDVPADVRGQMQFHVVGSVDQVLALALEPVVLAAAA